ncbi:MAG: hypothetical protein OIF58_07070, partial [Cohaesibacter sp.]|nr:hypothetical protein [Cohaesibacter sp.]
PLFSDDVVYISPCVKKFTLARIIVYFFHRLCPKWVSFVACRPLTSSMAAELLKSKHLYFQRSHPGVKEFVDQILP